MNAKACALAVAVVISLAATAPVSAQQVELAIPAGTTVETGPEGDKVLFIGRPSVAVDARDCARDSDPRMLQPVVLSMQVRAAAQREATRQSFCTSTVLTCRTGSHTARGLET